MFKDKIKFSVKLPSFSGIIAKMRQRDWVATIIFFLISFGASLYVWNATVVNETPRPSVVENFNKSQDDFEEMSRKVESAIKKLEARKQDFESANDYSDQREIFKLKETFNPTGGALNASNRSTNSNNSSVKVVQ